MSSHGIPEVLMKKVDEYVDALAPQIQPRITTELELFQQKTIDVLETQVIDAFRTIFNRDDGGGAVSGGPGPARGLPLDDAIPNAYGAQSLPFANEIATLTSSFGKIADETGDDLRDIFNLTEGNAGSGAGSGDARSLGDGEDQAQSHHSESARAGMKGFLSAAVNAVQDHLDTDSKVPGSSGGSQNIELDGLLGILSNSVKDVARSPEETARRISPEVKAKVGAKLREQHAPIAEQFTRIALDHIKRWMRGNTSTRDLGDGARGEIEEHVKGLVKGFGGLFGGKHHGGGEGASRGLGDHDGGVGGEGESGSGGIGFSKVISEKLSTGLGRVHREVRLEFRTVLGGIEKQLFELLPDELQGLLEKILGGNPFDSQLERDAGSGSGSSQTADRGFRDDIKTKLVTKIQGLVRKVQEVLRESILGVVNGGHRKFERASWVFVQDMVELKVQKYLPKVKINVPDDIGNEGVDLGAPKPSTQQPGGVSGGGGSGHSVVPPPNPQYVGGHQQQQQQQVQGGADYHQSQPQQQQPYQPHQEYRPDQYPPPPQSYPPPPQSYPPPPSGQHQQPPSYQQSQGQDYQGSQWHGQNPSY